MARAMSISAVREEVLKYKESTVEEKDVDKVLSKIKKYVRAVERYIASGTQDYLDTAQEILEIAKEAEDKLIKSKIDSEGSPDIDPSEIKYDPEKNYLGGGAFGAVYKCQCRGRQWAVKVPKEDWLDSEQKEAFKKEIHVMKKVYHPNVVLFLGASLDPIMIVTELMEGGDLNGLIHDPKKFAALTLERKLRIAIAIASGMNWLHGISHIIHRDLKPENILLDASGTPKIADFGLSDVLWKEGQVLEDGEGKGSPRYEAPEVMMGEEITNSVDVYSFGIILYELMTGKLPFANHNDYEPFREAVCDDGERPVVVESDNVPPAVVTLMAKCWDGVPTKRPSFEVVCSRLREILYEAMIPDEEPRRFWQTYFKEEESIPFDELCEMAEDMFLNIEPLKEILCQEGDKITMAHFTRLYRWFGAWFKFRESRETIQRIHELSAKDWFHGFISKETAMYRLNNRSLGTFLIRLSDTNPEYPLTISYIGQKDGRQLLQHTRIRKVGANPPVYEFNRKRFGSVDEIISCCADAGTLSIPCPKGALEANY